MLSQTLKEIWNGSLGTCRYTNGGTIVSGRGPHGDSSLVDKIDSKEWSGSLMYTLQPVERPCYSPFACVLDIRLSSIPTKHFEAIKRVFRLLKLRIMRDVKKIQEEDVGSANFLEIDWFDGHQRSKKKVGNIFILQRAEVHRHVWLVVLKSLDAIPAQRLTDLTYNKNSSESDILTKALPRERFEFLLQRLGQEEFAPDTLKVLKKEEV
ncbi:hypothetical protein Tco_0378786 [Tanacetum coccineum]